MWRIHSCPCRSLHWRLCLCCSLCPSLSSCLCPGPPSTISAFPLTPLFMHLLNSLHYILNKQSLWPKTVRVCYCVLKVVSSLCLHKLHQHTVRHFDPKGDTLRQVYQTQVMYTLSHGSGMQQGHCMRTQMIKINNNNTHRRMLHPYMQVQYWQLQ